MLVLLFCHSNRVFEQLDMNVKVFHSLLDAALLEIQLANL